MYSYVISAGTSNGIIGKNMHMAAALFMDVNYTSLVMRSAGGRYLNANVTLVPEVESR